MVQDRKPAKVDHAVKLKGVEAGRDKSQPYAAEVEDYASASVKTPVPDPQRKKAPASALDDAANRLRPIEASRGGKAR